MSRRCDCKRLIDAALNDTTLRLVPEGARWMWFVLANLKLANLENPGFRIGSAKEISIRFSIQETNVETYLETLIETGLLNRADDGSITLPELPGAPRRAAQSQENGGFGGRPRKGETAEQARERRHRQRNLPLMAVHAGGSAETQETQDETEPGKPIAAASLASEAERKQQLGSFVELGAELSELARMDNARGTFTYGPVKDWLMAGATPDMLRDVIAMKASRQSYQPPKTLSWFNIPIREAIEAAGLISAPPAPVNTAREAEFAVYNKHIQEFIEGGCRGDRPIHPDHKQVVA